MQALLKLAKCIDAANTFIGKSATWLVLIVVFISAANAILRYSIGWSSNAWLEVQWYLFSGIFLLCGGYVLLKNEHIRIDVICGRFSAKTQNWIDVFGFVVFLLPVALLTTKLSWDVFLMAWHSGEMSANDGGLIRWPVRLLLPIGCFLLSLQAISELIKRFAFIFGYAGDALAKAQVPSAEEELAREIAAQRGLNVANTHIGATPAEGARP